MGRFVAGEFCYDGNSVIIIIIIIIILLYMQSGSVSVPFTGTAYLNKLIKIPQQFRCRIFFSFHDVYPYLYFV